MGKVGKAFTGGLGQKAEKSHQGHYGVWACVRDWVEEEMVKCGVGPGQLACFRFDEKTRAFHFYGRLLGPQFLCWSFGFVFRHAASEHTCGRRIRFVSFSEAEA